MEISDIKIRKVISEGKMKAVVSVTFDGVLAVHDIKIIEGQERGFVAMPSRKTADGQYRDVVHPITSEFREMLESRIMEKYMQEIEHAGEGGGHVTE